MSLLHSLSQPRRLLLNVELCPPRIDLPLAHSVDAWIDSNRLIRKVTSQERFVFMTDGAIGKREEPNLRHVTLNLGTGAERSRIVPILTTKHTLEYCLEFAERAYDLGFSSMVVLGGDKTDDTPRCVAHAYELRKLIRRRVPGLALGGWASPHHGGRKQVDYILEPDYSADFYMVQITSHHDMKGLDEFLDAAEKRGVSIPGIFGVFYYRSANVGTLEMLSRFFPVPVKELQRDLEQGIQAEEICARSIRALRERGVVNVYVSNLPMATGVEKLNQIEARVRDFNHVV